MSIAPDIATSQTGWTQKYQGPAARAASGGRTAGTMPDYQPMPGGKTGFLGFLGTLLDVINPLHHIPVIGSLYRELTGDQLSPMARVMGDTLYGGPIGAGVALANIAVESHSGRDIGGTVMAALRGDETPASLAENVQVASAETAHSSASAAQIVANPPVLSAGDIVWDAPASPHKNFSTASLSVHPTPTRTRTADGEPAGTGGPDTSLLHRARIKSETPVHIQEGTSAGGRLTASAGTGPALDLPEALVDARTALPPELMAIKMQEGLDKYAAMMKARSL